MRDKKYVYRNQLLFTLHVVGFTILSCCKFSMGRYLHTLTDSNGPDGKTSKMFISGRAYMHVHHMQCRWWNAENYTGMHDDIGRLATLQHGKEKLHQKWYHAIPLKIGHRIEFRSQWSSLNTTGQGALPWDDLLLYNTGHCRDHLITLVFSMIRGLSNIN